jgi:hypothetical protein
MDSDSLIYIIIAIILAVVNAIAQKKKKAGAAKATPVVSDEIYNENEIEEVTEPTTFEKADPLKFFFDKELFLEEADSAEQQNEELPEEQNIEEILYGPSVEQEALLARAQEMLLQESQEITNSSYDNEDFDFEKDSIASSAITDALTEAEQEEELELSQSQMKREFDVQKAIIYSEIIKPKYFSLHSNFNN